MNITRVTVIVAIGAIAVICAKVFRASEGVGAGKSEETTLSAAPALVVTQPKIPDRLANAKQKIEETSRLLETQLIPLLKKMPEEVKRAQDLIRMNDQLIRHLAESSPMNALPPTQ